MKVDVAYMIKGANPARVHFIGHSLGRALATLAALHYAGTATGTTQLYTFGAPQIGGRGLTSTINNMIGATNVKRVYALADPVLMIPLFPFMHCDSGASAINAGFDGITADAHSMDGSYIGRMPADVWPDTMASPNKADHDYWLKMAERESRVGSKMGYYFLGKALAQIP